MLESLQESGRNSEKEKIELEVQNGTLDPESMNVIDDIITKFGQWFGKPRVEQCVDSWIKYLALKRNPNESVEDFIVKQDQRYSGVDPHDQQKGKLAKVTRVTSLQV